MRAGLVFSVALSFFSVASASYQCPGNREPAKGDKSCWRGDSQGKYHVYYGSDLPEHEKHLIQSGFEGMEFKMATQAEHDTNRPQAMKENPQCKTDGSGTQARDEKPNASLSYRPTHTSSCMIVPKSESDLEGHLWTSLTSTNGGAALGSGKTCIMHAWGRGRSRSPSPISSRLRSSSVTRRQVVNDHIVVLEQLLKRANEVAVVLRKRDEELAELDLFLRDVLDDEEEYYD